MVCMCPVTPILAALCICERAGDMSRDTIFAQWVQV